MDFLSPVLKLIGPLLLDEYARITGISDKLKTWGGKLRTIRAVLDSAEEKQMNGDTATATWLSDLRDVTYDMEDLLEEFSVEAKRGTTKVQALSRATKLPYCLIACCSRFSPCTLFSDHHMANEIEEVSRRLEEICSSIPILGLVQNLRSVPHNHRPSFITTSLPEPKFVGREKQIKELLARLAGSEEISDSSRPFTIVSIVGMGGLGKTTLAQELYHKAGFEVKAWACVSDVFDMAAITKSILDQVAPSSSSEGKDLNLLQNSLREKISGKKFLIVLDDVWNDDYNELESLVKPLYSGSKGSRILLTTRNLEVTKSVGDPHPMRLDLLPLEDGVSLLAYHSFGEKNFEQHPLLRDIAVQLAEKCKGLPLSVKAIGRLLRFKIDEKEWKGLLTHDIWSKEGNIPPALKLSYLHLPVHLRRCFAACAVFPKDYMFDQDEVIQMWIIHGLLQKGTGQTYQKVGMENLRWLEAVSLFQKVRDDESYYSMHDLVNDLAKSIDECSYFSSDEYKVGSICQGKSLGKVRHASMVTQVDESLHSKRFDVYREMKKLRTFSAFQISTHRWPNVCVSGEVICDLIMNMKNLRMLSLSCFRVSKLPDQIGELKLLRSINLSQTEIEGLPESICDLVELQSLLLRDCHELKDLPKNIHRLTNLLHLDITGTNSLREMPPRIGDLANLEILSDFIVGKDVGRGLKQLGPLNCLQRGLHISNLLAVDDVKDARVANLPGKEGVLDLSLDWGSCSEVSRENDHQFELLLQHLQPSENIESLTISGYGARRFPSWFDNPLRLKYVVRITLSDCGSVDSLPPLGQLPSLESLDINSLHSVSSISAEFYGTEKPYFPKLRSLSFLSMESWEKWLFHGENENDQPFPCLRQLKVLNCPKLKGGCSLSLPSVVEIDINGCDGGLLNCLAGLTSMTKMVITEIPQLVHFDRRFQTSWVSLEEMRIRNCPQFKSFVDGDSKEQLPPKLKKLEISGCGDIVKLPDDLSGLTSLKEMSISGCKSFSSFPSEGLPVSLRSLSLHNCQPQSPFKLPDSLEELNLWDLQGLVLINDIAPVSRSLRQLEIHHCTSLTTLTDSLQHLSALSDLYLQNCPELDVFPTLPCNLSLFVLGNCPKVKSLPQDMQRLTSLKELFIQDCQGITSFPDLPCNLSSFLLDNCPNVNYLPQDMQRLTSLKELFIQDCEGITSLPRGGLPPYLESLVISGCQKLNQSIEKWGLRDLTALRELRIRGRMEWMDEMKVFPPPRSVADWSGILPSSLLELTIGKMEKLERVGGGLRDHLTSLQSLHMFSCERMRWLPEDGLPDSLELLCIEGCPLLMEKCRKGEGEYWHSHLRLIPRIEIDSDI